MRQNWEDLANAVVLKAVEDYRKIRKQLREDPDQALLQKKIRELERFFRSPWFSILCDIDGSTILYNLRREAA